LEKFFYKIFEFVLGLTSRIGMKNESAFGLGFEIYSTTKSNLEIARVPTPSQLAVFAKTLNKKLAKP
jgi:uncharacterized phage infection (PIP) family protein YhgE